MRISSAIAFLVLVSFTVLNADFESQRAYDFLTKRDYPKSLHYYDIVTQRQPDNIQLRLEYVTALRLGGMLNQSLKEAFIALEYNENDIDTWIQIGETYTQMHQWQKAFDALKKSIELNEGGDMSISVKSLLDLGYRMLKYKETANSIEVIEAALKHSADSSIALVQLGAAHFANGNKGRGRDFINQGIEAAKIANNSRTIQWAEFTLNELENNAERYFASALLIDSYQLLAEELSQGPEIGDAKSIFGHDRFDIWISQFPGELPNDLYSQKAKTMYDNIMKIAEDTLYTPIEENVNGNDLSYIIVKVRQHDPYNEQSFPYILQGAFRHKKGYFFFTIFGLSEKSVLNKLDIIKTLRFLE